MKFAIIDTEGSGLFKYRDKDGKPLPADAPGQPRLAALCLILLNDDADLTIAEEYVALVKPDGWSMEADATAVNGLTDERLNAEGKPVAEVLAVYSQAIQEGYVMVAFNAQHDLKQMRSALRHAGMPDLFEQTRNICVMRKAQGVIPRPDGKSSWPKLDHCRAHLGLGRDGAHEPSADAHAALAVFRHLLAQGVEMAPQVHYAKEVKPEAVPVEPEAIPDAPISRPRGAAAAGNEELPR